MGNFCKICGKPVGNGAELCEACSKTSVNTASETVVCPYCEKVIPKLSKFCPKCGTFISSPKPILVSETTSADGGKQAEPVSVSEPEPETYYQKPEEVSKDPEQYTDPDDNHRKKLPLPLILGVVFALVVIMIMVVKPHLPGSTISAEEPADTQNPESPTDDQPEETAEPEEPDEPGIEEPESEMIDLTNTLNDIDELHSILHGIERTASGPYEHWYQDLNDTYGYGNYPGGNVVDEFWVCTEGYSVYDVYVNQEIEEAASCLSDYGWLLDDVYGNTYSFRMDTSSLSLTTDDSKLVVNISLIKDFFHEEPEVSETKDPEPSSETAKDDSYFFPNSLDELLDESQLYGMTARELTLARNEVYARYGYKFKRQELQEYFNTKSWYHMDPSVNADTIGSIVSKTGMKNMVMIREYQKRTGLTY